MSPQPPATAAAGPKWARKRVVIPAVVLLFLVGVGVGAAGGGDDSGEDTAGAKPAATTTVTETARPKAAEGAPAPTVTKTVKETVTAKAKAPAKPKGVTIPGDGTFVVGEDVQPGTYKTGGPEESVVPNCYWARLKSTSGDFEDIITNGNAQGPTTVTIAAGDGAFQSTGCQEWVKSG